MSTATDRRSQVAALRLQTRKYLIEARGRRLGLITDPEPEPEPERQPSPPAAARAAPGFLPDPRIAAMAPAPAAPELAPAPSVVAPVHASLKQLPLGALRLLGQGMIWRLNNLGVRTLDELAACDPKRLGEGLGPIGRLVRTEVWVEAAREILSQK